MTNIDTALNDLRAIRDTRCPRCAGDLTPAGPTNSSYRERICAPIGERFGELGFIMKTPYETIIRPAEGYVVELVIEGQSRKLTSHQARTWANGLNTLADVVDQLNNHWTGPRHVYQERNP